MNRKQRRELRKDKNLIRNLYAIIQKYLPELFNRFYNLTDTRNQSYVTYDMKVICVTRLFGLLCGLTSLSIISDDNFNTDACIENAESLPLLLLQVSARGAVREDALQRAGLPEHRLRAEGGDPQSSRECEGGRHR